MEYTDEKLNKALEQLVNSTCSPQGKYAPEESYRILKRRLFPERTYSLSRWITSSAAAIVLLCALGWSIYQYTSPIHTLTISTLAETKAIRLPDGTEVILNNFTSISYPEKFKKKNREITLAGEAYFEVSKDKEHPFIVQTEAVDVQVLGTHFNIEAYPKDSEITTTLLEGSVAVSNKSNSERIVLKPNESAIYNKIKGNLTLQLAENALDEIAWRNGTLIFKNLPLQDIMRELSNSFGVDIRLNDPSLGEYKLSARFANSETLHDILQLLQEAGGFRYVQSGQSIDIIRSNN